MSGDIGNQQLVEVEESVLADEMLQDELNPEKDPQLSGTHVPLLILFGYQLDGEKHVR